MQAHSPHGVYSSWDIDASEALLVRRHISGAHPRSTMSSAYVVGPNLSKLQNTTPIQRPRSYVASAIVVLFLVPPQLPRTDTDYNRNRHRTPIYRYVVNTHMHADRLCQP